MKRPMTVLYVAAQEDEPLRQRLERHLTLLERQGWMQGWHVQQIEAGRVETESREAMLQKASLVLLLISADFFASLVCQEQMQRALERQQQGEIEVIPILLRSVYEKGAPFAHLQMLPRNGKPITNWSNQDEAFTEVVKEIARTVSAHGETLLRSEWQTAQPNIEQGSITDISLSPPGARPIPTQSEQAVATISYPSCFLAHASEDHQLAEQLYNDLSAQGVRCWLAHHDLMPGDHIRERIEQVIGVQDKLLLILSQHSVQSHWVQHEVRRALNREVQQNKVILFPIRIDDVVLKSNSGWAQDLRENRFIGDFTRWTVPAVYQEKLTLLLQQLSVIQPSQKKVQPSRRPRFFLLFMVVLVLIVGSASVFTQSRLFSGGVVAAPMATEGPTATLALESRMPTVTANLLTSITPTINIVPARLPTLSDPLLDNSKGVRWDEWETSDQRCGFVTGKYYLLKAEAQHGIGCNTEASQSNFGNFVFQITMTILSGVNNTSSGAGPQFRIEPDNNVSHYKVTFDVRGNWHLWMVVDDNNASILPGALCSNPCPYFHTGLNQPNIFTIRAVGNKIDLWVNGYLIDSCSDSTYTSGFLGVRLDPGTQSASVAFSNLRVWQL